MIEQYSFAWNKKEKVWCEIYGSYPTEDDYNPNAKQFLVRNVVSDTYETHKVSAANLTVLNFNDFVEVKRQYPFSGTALTIIYKVRCMASKVEVFGKDSYFSVHWADVVGPAPKGYKVPEFEVGDLVDLINENQYYGIVTEVIELTSHKRYTVQYFQHSEYAKMLDKGVQKGYASILVDGNCLSKVDLPAPRIIKSAVEREVIRLQYQRNINSSNHIGYWRYRGSWNYAEVTRINKHGGALLAKVIAEAKLGKCDTLGINGTRVLERLNGLHPASRDAVWKLMGEVARDENILVQCPECGEIEWYDDMHWTDYYNTEFCSSCEGNWTFSTIMSDWIRDADSIPYFESTRAFHNGNVDDYVIRAWVNRNSDLYMYDGCVVDEDTYNALNDEDEDEDDPYDNDGLSGYHSSHRVWKEVWANKSYLPLGLEIEVYSEERRDAVSAVRSVFPTMYLEQDGSLDSRYGFEVITQPWGKDEWALHGKQLLNTMKANDCKAYNSPAGRGYGIHININRNYLTPLQEMRMFMFLAASENKDFVSAIAQRSSIYNADVNIGQFGKERQTVSQAGGFRHVYIGDDGLGNSQYVKKISGRGKYAPIKLHEDRLEIRIFQSTLNASSFNKDLEFTWALLEWTNVKASTGNSWMHTDFVKWLAKRPHLEHDYPNLAAFLRKPSYKIIEGDTINNTWKDLIPKETRRSVPQNVVDGYFVEGTVEEEVVLAMAA